MQFTTILLSLSLAFTVSAAPLLAKRQGVYNIDGEPTTFYLDHDEDGHIIPPADFPYYDSLNRQCEAHRNYLPRIGIKKWEKECPPKILQWKIDHNVCESQLLAAEAKMREEERKQKEEQEAAEAKADEEQRRQIQKEKMKNMLRDCKRASKGWWCEMLLQKDAKLKKEKEAQAGDGVKEVVA